MSPLYSQKVSDIKIYAHMALFKPQLHTPINTIYTSIRANMKVDYFLYNWHKFSSNPSIIDLIISLSPEHPNLRHSPICQPPIIGKITTTERDSACCNLSKNNRALMSGSGWPNKFGAESSFDAGYIQCETWMITDVQTLCVQYALFIDFTVIAAKMP